jgi:hypothetical protein
VPGARDPVRAANVDKIATKMIDANDTQRGIGLK